MARKPYRRVWEHMLDDTGESCGVGRVVLTLPQEVWPYYWGPEREPGERVCDRRHLYVPYAGRGADARLRELALGNMAVEKAEAKLRYDEGDRAKLALLVGDRRNHLLVALRTHAHERRFPDLLPVETLVLRPVLVFKAEAQAPSPPPKGTSYLRIIDQADAYFEGDIGSSK